MKYIKIYGLQRSGTNFLKALIEANFDCRVLQNILGEKHNFYNKNDLSISGKEINTDLNKSQLLEVQKLKKEDNLKSIFITKKIENWIVSVSDYRKNSKEYTNWQFNLNDLINEYNDKNLNWRNNCDFEVNYLDLINKSEYILNLIQQKFKLKRKAYIYEFEKKLKKAPDWHYKKNFTKEVFNIRQEKIKLNTKEKKLVKFKQKRVTWKSVTNKKFSGKYFGGLASFLKRKDYLEQNIKSIYQNVDWLFVYLNDYKKVPEFFCKYKNVVPILGYKEAGDLTDIGKFYMANKVKGVFFCLDDDFEYSKEHFELLKTEFDKKTDISIFATHGRNLDFPLKKLYFPAKLQSSIIKGSKECFLNFVGTGAVAFDTKKIKIDYKKFYLGKMTDVFFMVLTKNELKKCISHTGVAKTLSCFTNGIFRERYNKHKEELEILNKEFCKNYQEKTKYELNKIYKFKQPNGQIKTYKYTKNIQNLLKRGFLKKI